MIDYELPFRDFLTGARYVLVSWHQYFHHRKEYKQLKRVPSVEAAMVLRDALEDGYSITIEDFREFIYEVTCWGPGTIYDDDVPLLKAMRDEWMDPHSEMPEILLLEAPPRKIWIPPPPAEFAPPPPVEAKTDEPTWVEIELEYPDGAPVAYRDVKIELPTGKVIYRSTNEAGIIRYDQIDDPGTCKVSFVNYGVSAAAAPNQVDPGFTQIEEPKVVQIIEMEDVTFNTDREILMPDAAATGDADVDAVTGLDVIAAALAFAKDNDGKKLLVVGHTDKAGSAQHNLKLSERRAENAHLYLSGERSGWAGHCEKNQEVADVQRVCAWAAAEFGWGSDPGGVDGKTGPKTRRGMDGFRRDYNAEFGGSLPESDDQRRVAAWGASDWEAVYDAYDRALGELIGTDDVAAAKDGVTFLGTPTLGCGEEWPQDAKQNVSGGDRRVEFLFFDEGEEPDLGKSPAGADVYEKGSEFVRVYVAKSAEPVEGEDYWVLTDRRAEEFTDDPDLSIKLKLTGSGGREWKRDLRTRSVDHGGFADVLFQGLKAGETFTLVMQHGDAPEETVFEDVPFGELARSGTELDAVAVAPSNMSLGGGAPNDVPPDEAYA